MKKNGIDVTSSHKDEKARSMNDCVLLIDIGCCFSLHTKTRKGLVAEDMLNQILLRLPVESLLRCRAVSKPWCSLISSRSFVKSHFTHAITSPGAEETLLLRSFQKVDESDNSILFLNLDSCQRVGAITFFSSKNGLPFVPEPTLVGSYAGIVCITIYTDDPVECWMSLSRGEGHMSTYLCNPATKVYKLIPPANIRPETLRVSSAFGFDPIDNDFKVVRLVNFPLAVEVYSTNMNVWRNVETKPKDVPNLSDFHVCCNGYLCWVGDDGIEAFDLNKEEFIYGIKLPDKSDHFTITDLNDSVAVIVSEGNRINMWTLDDVGCFQGGEVEASWTLKLSIDADLPVHFVHSYFRSGVLLLKSDDGDGDDDDDDDNDDDDDEKWFFYNIDRKVSRKIPDSLHWCQAFKYRESLVSITGSEQGK